MTGEPFAGHIQKLADQKNMSQFEKNNPVAVKTKINLYQGLMIALITALAITAAVSGSIALYFAINPVVPIPLADTCQPQAGSNNYYVDIQSKCGPCSDIRTKEQNTVTSPWCTVAQAASVAAPGDTVNIQEGRYGQDFNFAISGTAAAPITYRGLGSPIPLIGFFDDVRDENFIPTSGKTNVFEMAYTRPRHGNDVGFQTHFAPILVDDDDPRNPAKFYLVEADGPITLALVPSIDEVQRVEGSWYHDGAKLYVHPYGNSAPTTPTADIVIGPGHDGGRIDITANYNNFDKLSFNYFAYESMRATGSYNRYTNLVNFRGFSGSYNYGENLTASNLIYRMAAGDYSFIESAEGWGFGINGSHNTLRDVRIYHNFNNFTAQGDHQTIQNITVHGAPNHGFETHLTNSIVSNVAGYGNQDIFYIRPGNTNTIFEGYASQDGITFEENDGNGTTFSKNSDLTFRNIIFNSGWIGEGGYGVHTCEYEATITVENAIFMVGAGEQVMIQHCVDGDMERDPKYTLADYQAGCQAGTITNCMTLRNIQVVTSGYENVLTGGRYIPETDNWNVHIPDASSPAYNTGSPQTFATVDIEDNIRPQGGGYDIGADEYDLGRPPDTTPPVISSITATPGSTTATITWTTDEPSTSQVQYGLTASYGSLSTLDTNLVTSHSVQVTGLNPDTVYHFGTRSKDAAGNEAISPDQTSRTLLPVDSTPPVISSITATPGSTTATITWTTDEPSMSQVNYGLTAGYGSSSALDTSFVTSHSIQLTGLSQDTFYHFRVRSKDASANEALSPDQTFRTLVAADAIPPVISGITAAPAATAVTITWATSEPATSQVNYGTTSSYGRSTSLNPTLVTLRSVRITGLHKNTLYHFRVRSKDAWGNEAVSSDQTFRTLRK